MYERWQLKQLVEDRLGDRSLVWAGLRGADAEALADLAQFSAVVSIIDRYTGRVGIEGLAYEDLSGRRVDLEIWDIDEHPRHPNTETFRRRLLSLLSEPSALVPYRPSRFLSAAVSARSHTCLNLGLHGAHQQAFEHKPWIESLLADTGVTMVPWRYVSDDDRHVADNMLRSGPIVLRRSRTSGGEGIQRVDDPDELMTHWMTTEEHFLSVAPFVADTIPLNIGGTVWHDGVTVHLPSAQIIGVSSCSVREFGYCGNDFALPASLEPWLLTQLEAQTRRIGEVLAHMGYLGTFGVDFLLQGDTLYFMEVNPRFQGSTPLSSRLAIGLGRSDLLLEHIAAFLGIDAPGQQPVRTLVAEVPAAAQLVVHSTAAGPAELDVESLHKDLVDAGFRASLEVAAPSTVLTNHGATACRLRLPASITTTGFEINPSLDNVIRHWQERINNGGTMIR